MDNKGKLIVLEGIDSAGKATQAKSLIKRLENSGHRTAYFDFPQYNSRSSGFVENFLEGKYGPRDSVDPYVTTLFFALDRFDACRRIKEFLDRGSIVIANRYTYSNLAYQGAKIDSTLARRTFFDWALNLEYRLLGLPNPDRIIFLSIEPATAYGLNKFRLREDWTGKTNDINENDIVYQDKVQRTYLEIARLYPGISIIECTKNRNILPPESINDLIWDKITDLVPQSRQHIAPNFRELHDNPPEFSACARNKIDLAIRQLTPLARYPQPEGDNCYILYAADYYSIIPGESMRVRTGIALSLPDSCFGMITDHKGRPLKMFGRNSDDEIRFDIGNNTHDIINISPGQKIGYLFIQKIDN